MFFVTIKCIDTIYFIFGQGKMIKFCILLNVIGIAGTGNYYNALLQIPA